MAGSKGRYVGWFSSGSSLTPAFREALRDALPRAELAATGTFTSVAAGLAIAGTEEGEAAS